MHIRLEVGLVQYLIVLITILTISFAIGLKRGWRGQVMAFVPIAGMWVLLSTKGDVLVGLANTMYRGLLFLTSCATDSDTGACMESMGLLQAVLIHPESPGEVRLLFLVTLVATALLSFLLVLRFGKAPHSMLQRLMGAVLGVANGFTLSYLLLPFLPYREQIPFAAAQSAVQTDVPRVVESFPQLALVPNLDASVVVVIVLAVFVIIAVRLIRPTST
jgi:membrane-associated HD superfamily phosphohydrolase